MLDRLNRMSDQEAADAVNLIADNVKELSDLMDQFFTRTSPEINSKFEEAWKNHIHVGKDVADRLHRLAASF